MCALGTTGKTTVLVPQNVERRAIYRLAGAAQVASAAFQRRPTQRQCR